MRWPLDSFSINEGYAGHPPALDLAAPSGVPIKAPESGKVLLVNNDPKAYFGGMYIRMQGASGNQYYMGHNSKNNVSVGQEVNEGDVIGAVGMTGFAIPAQGIDAPSGPHVHFECIVNNVSVDFRTIIKQGEDEMFEGRTAQQWHDLYVATGQPNDGDIINWLRWATGNTSFQPEGKDFDFYKTDTPDRGWKRLAEDVRVLRQARDDGKLGDVSRDAVIKYIQENLR